MNATPSSEHPDSRTSVQLNGSTARSPSAWVTLLLVTAAALGLDLWSKHWAFGTLAGFPVLIDREAVLAGSYQHLIPRDLDPWVAIPGLLEFKLVLNVGAVFGAGAGKRWLFIGVTVFAVMFAFFLFAFWTKPRDRWAHLGIGLLLAGGLGNLYDRIIFGCVRDFIHPFPGIKLPFGWTYSNGDNQLWPYVSNVADKWLLVGILLLLLHAWKQGGAEPVKHDAPAV